MARVTYKTIPLVTRLALQFDQAVGSLISGELGKTVSEVIADQRDTTVQGAHFLLLDLLPAPLRRRKTFKVIERIEFESAAAKGPVHLGKTIRVLSVPEQRRMLRKYRASVKNGLVL